MPDNSQEEIAGIKENLLEAKEHLEECQKEVVAAELERDFAKNDVRDIEKQLASAEARSNHAGIPWNIGEEKCTTH